MAGAAPGAVSVVWFRVGDLRLADHEPLSAAIAAGDAGIVPFFCLDSSTLRPSAAPGEKGSLGLPATGPHRLAALLHAVAGIRASIRGLGSDLVCAAGGTAGELGALAAALAAGSPPPAALTLRFYPSPTAQLEGGDAVAEEAARAFLAAAAAAGVPAAVGPGPALHDALYPPAAVAAVGSDGELPEGRNDLEAALRVLKMKPTMTEFRRAVQGGGAPPRRPLPPPAALPPLPAAARGIKLNGGDVCEAGARWREVYVAAGAAEALAALEAAGGPAFLGSGALEAALGPAAAAQCQHPASSEAEAAARLRALAGPAPGAMASYHESRMLAGNGHANSAMLSLALSLGSLSPRTAYWEVLEAMLAREGAGGGGAAAAESWAWSEPTPASPGHHWLLMHLGIRDYFIYWALANGRAAAAAPGGAGWNAGPEALARWAGGRTGLPYVDACMRELAATGWVSNRGRQNAASLWAKGAGGDWRAGAAVFGALLVDHDSRLNLGNWAYVAGAGADPRDRTFRTVTQGERYDPGGRYVAAWVPEVAGLPPALRHRPWEAPPGEGAGGGSGGGWPPPMVDPATQVGKPRGERKKGG